MLFVVEERHEGEKYNNDFGGRGLGVGGHRGVGGDRYVDYGKKRKCSNTFVNTHCISFMILNNIRPLIRLRDFGFSGSLHVIPSPV